MRTFVAASSDAVELGGGLLGTITGAKTIAVIQKRASDTGTVSLVFSGAAAGTARHSLDIATTALRARSGSSVLSAPTITVTAADGLSLIGWSRAAGTSSPRFHEYVFATNTWTHENSASTFADSTSTSGDTWIGSGASRANPYDGEIDCVGFWDRVLTDAEFENLVFSRLAWLASNPLAFLVFDQGTTSQKVRDLTGHGVDESGTFGTAVSATSVPWLSYGARMFAVDSTSSLLLPTSIASAQAVGTPAIAARIFPSGIASAEAFGTPLIQGQVLPPSITTQEAVGTPTVIPGALSPGSIASEETFGSPTLSGQSYVAPSSIGSGQAFGAVVVRSPRKVIPVGIPSVDQPGTPSVSGPTVHKTLKVRLQGKGIRSQEAVGTPTLTGGRVGPASIASSEAIGVPHIVRPLTVEPVGIPSAEVVPEPGLLFPDTIVPTAIASLQGFGTPQIVRAGTISPDGIASEEDVGEPTLLTLAQLVLPESILSDEAAGQPTIQLLLAAIIRPDGIEAGAVGEPTVTQGPNGPIEPASVTSRERFGLPRFLVGVPENQDGQPGRIANRIYDTATGLAFAFDINHSEEEAHAFRREYEMGAPTTVKLARQQRAGEPLHLTLKGTILDPAQKAALDELYAACEYTTLTYEDYSGEAYEVVMTGWDCRPERGRNPLTRGLHIWRHTTELEVLSLVHGPTLDAIGNPPATPPDIERLDAARPALRPVGVAAVTAFGNPVVLGGDGILLPTAIAPSGALGLIEIVGGEIPDSGGGGTPPPGKTLVFEDDFDGAGVNTTYWGMYNGPGHGNNGLRRPSAFSTSGGNLVITASWDGANITSGGMAHRANYTYGWFEVRARVERDWSNQLSGLALTWPQNDVWPWNGENDFYETGRPNDTIKAFIHTPGPSSTAQVPFNYGVSAQEWHVIAMDWQANYLRLYRDGALVKEITDTTLFPHTPHHLSLQLDALDNNALPGPVRMYFDYVRIYR